MQIYLPADIVVTSSRVYTWNQERNQPLLGRAARCLLVDRLPTDLHCRWPCISCSWLAGHPEKQHKYGKMIFLISSTVKIIEEHSIIIVFAVPVLDGRCHSHESLLNIDGIFGTSLHEWDAKLISKCLRGIFLSI
jgi:hypothetical protein